MSEHHYTPFHPRWYRSRVSTWWWLKRWSSLAFIMRELSSIFVALFVIFLLLLLRAVGNGDAAYREFLVWAASPYVVLINMIGFVFIVFHAITWFNLAPQAMAVHFQGKRVPGTLIMLSNYVAWAAVSIVVVWVFLVMS